MCFIVCSILAQFIWRSSHDVISNKVHVPSSAWPATIDFTGTEVAVKSSCQRDKLSARYFFAQSRFFGEAVAS
jgi:hypothetical protein